MANIHKITNKLLNTNTYIFIDNNNCFLIDPGSDYETIRSFIDSNNLNVLAVLATHGHFDHIVSVSKLQKEFKSKFYLHLKDAKTLKLANFIMKIFGYKQKIEIPNVDVFIDGVIGSLRIQDYCINYMHTPGHTAGSCVFQIENNIFTGDTLFYSENESKIPNEDLISLGKSQRLIFENYDKNIIFWPGHGCGGELIEIKNYILEKKHK
jgi:glyoxylase-like metal-dependent hydrolase (beta-lactamase superfamily II)